MTQFPQTSDSKDEGVSIRVPNKSPLNACEHVLNLPRHGSHSPPLRKTQQVFPPAVAFINVKKVSHCGSTFWGCKLSSICPYLSFLLPLSLKSWNLTNIKDTVSSLDIFWNTVTLSDSFSLRERKVKKDVAWGGLIKKLWSSLPLFPLGPMSSPLDLGGLMTASS